MVLFQHQELNKRLIAHMNEPVSENEKRVVWGWGVAVKNPDDSSGFDNLTPFHIF